MNVLVDWLNTQKNIGRIAGSFFALASTLTHAGNLGTFRYDDDFTALRDNGSAYAQLKHIDLGADTRYLSIGGDMRERMEYYSRTNLGPHAADYNNFLLHRLLLHIDSHWDAARLFLQLGNHEEFGREPAPKPTDVDHADVQQAFVDYRIAFGETDKLTLRGGRQEIAFGASRLIAVREGPNIHVDFDGVRARWNSPLWDISAIAVRPVAIEPGQFDDKSTHGQALWGLYASVPFTAAEGFASNDKWSGDFYYLGATNNNVHYDSIAGSERRNTFGARGYGRSGAFDTDIEIILQDGTVSGEAIRAFALATDSGWSWSEAGWKPRLGLRTDIISGDRDRHDDTLQTFNALYPSGSYFSEASIIAQANLLDFSASLALKPITSLTLTWSINPLWRYSTHDALYTLPLAPLIAGDSSTARYIGTQNQLLAIWQYNAFLSFKAALVKFEPGGFVKKNGGNNLDYAQLATIVRF